MLTDVSVTVSACTPPASSGEKTRPGASATNRDRAARGSSGKRAGRRRQKTHHVCADAVDTLAADACVLEGRLVEGLLAPPRPAPPRPAARAARQASCTDKRLTGSNPPGRVTHGWHLQLNRGPRVTCAVACGRDRGGQRARRTVAARRQPCACTQAGRAAVPAR